MASSGPTITSYPFAGPFASPFQDHKQPLAPFQDCKVQIVHPSEDHLSAADVRDIIALKHTFPTSFDSTGNIPGEYTICVDPAVPPVQYVCRKVPIESREEIEKPSKNGRQRIYNTSN